MPEVETMQWLVYTLLGAGVLAAAVRPARLAFLLDLNAEAFISQVKKLVRADNIDRATRLARFIPHAPAGRAALSFLEAYRNGVRDVEMLGQLMDAALGDLDSELRRPRWSVPVAVACCAAGLALGISGGRSLAGAPLVLAGAAAVLVAAGLFKSSDVRRKTALVRRELLGLVGQDVSAGSRG